MKRWSIILAIALLSIMLLVGVAIIFKEPILLAIGDFLIIQDELQPADVIHVIAGDEYRLDYAIQLYQQGYGKKIILTGGGWCPTHQVNHGIVWKGEAIEQGVPPEDIVIDESDIISTFEEILRLKSWIDQNPNSIHSVIVVSDPFHMRRARWTARRVLGKQVEILMAYVPFEETPFNRTWWEDRASRRYVKDEYLKFFYYIARYRLSWGFVKEWLASLDTE